MPIQTRRDTLPLTATALLERWQAEANGSEEAAWQLERHYADYARRICEAVPADDAVLAARDRALRTTRQLCQFRVLAPNDDPTRKQLAVERALAAFAKACRHAVAAHAPLATAGAAPLAGVAATIGGDARPAAGTARLTAGRA